MKYGDLLMKTLAVKATVRKHVERATSYRGLLQKSIEDPGEKVELLALIDDYHRELTPLIVPH